MKNKIDGIVDSWNANLQDFYKKDIVLNGLVTPIVRRDESDVYFPVIVNAEGYDKYVFTDDKNDIGVYHKLLTKTYQPNQKASFGDEVTQRVTAEMILICWGFIDRFPRVHEVESRITSLAPKGVNVRISNFDRINVFQQEFGNIPFFLTNKEFLFSIRYQITYDEKKGCS